MQSKIVVIYKNVKLNIVINFDDATGENRQEQNPCCSQVPDHPYGMVIVGGSGSKQNKCIIQSNELPTRYWQNLFVC